MRYNLVTLTGHSSDKKGGKRMKQTFKSRYLMVLIAMIDSIFAVGAGTYAGALSA